MPATDVARDGRGGEDMAEGVLRVASRARETGVIAVLGLVPRPFRFPAGSSSVMRSRFEEKEKIRQVRQGKAPTKDQRNEGGGG